MQSKLFWMILLLLLLQVGVAQVRNFTLDECIQYAIEHNPQRSKQEAQNRIYKLDQLEAIGGFLPSLSAGTNLYLNFGRGLDPETNTYISTNALSNGYELYASWTLFNGLSQIYTAKLAKINRLKGVNDLQEMKDKIAFEVMELFFNALYYKGTVELALMQWEESNNNLKKIERMEELGLKSIPDLTEIQAKEAEDRFILTKQTNLYHIEIIKLKEKMNFSIEQDLSISHDKTVLTNKIEDSALDIYKQALSYLPRILAADNSLSANKMQNKIARGHLFPTLSLSAGINTGFSRYMDGSDYVLFSDQFKNRKGSYVGLSLSIPILDGFSRISQLGRSKQQFLIAKNEHKETLHQVYSDIEQTVADVNGLSDEYLHAQKRTTAMLSAHQMNLRKYEEGLIDAIDLSISSNRLLQSRIEELHTQLSYQLKYRLLQYYRGAISY